MNNVEAIIMAAGIGSRLEEASNGKPKSYLKIGGEWILERNLRLLRQVGVKRFVIVVGYQKEHFMSDFGSEDVEFVYNPFYRTANVLSSFWMGADRLTSDFYYLHADTVFDPEILTGLAAQKGDLVLSCDRKSCGEEEMKYKTTDGCIREINKTMDAGEAEGEFLGLCRIGKRWTSELREIGGRRLGEGEYGAFFEVALQELIDRHAAEMRVHDVGGLPWAEIDFPEDYEQAKKVIRT